MENLTLELITFVSSCEAYAHFFSLSIGRLRGTVGRELLSYTVGPWFVSQGSDIFRRFPLSIQLVIRARIARLPSPVT